MTLAPKIAMSDDFLKSFAAVPRDQQQAVLTFVAKFRQNRLPQESTTSAFATRVIRTCGRCESTTTFVGSC